MCTCITAKVAKDENLFRTVEDAVNAPSIANFTDCPTFGHLMVRLYCCIHDDIVQHRGEDSGCLDRVNY